MEKSERSDPTFGVFERPHHRRCWIHLSRSESGWRANLTEIGCVRSRIPEARRTEIEWLARHRIPARWAQMPSQAEHHLRGRIQTITGKPKRNPATSEDGPGKGAYLRFSYESHC
jgi:hypothetical protein